MGDHPYPLPAGAVAVVVSEPQTIPVGDLQAEHRGQLVTIEEEMNLLRGTLTSIVHYFDPDGSETALTVDTVAGQTVHARLNRRQRVTIQALPGT